MFMAAPLGTKGLTGNLLINIIITFTLFLFAVTLLQKIYKVVVKENIK